MRLQSSLVIGLVAASGVGLAQTSAVMVPVARARVPVSTGVLKKVVVRGNRVYLLDSENHRVVIVNGPTVTTMGRIGNGLGDLYQAFDFDVDRQGSVYVQDHGNARITIFADNGRPLAGFPDVPTSMGIAAGPNGTVYLGRPQLGSLITLCGRSGKKVRSIGTLVRPSTILGPSFARYDVRAAAFNRVHLAVDDAGNVWAAFAFMPLLYKFSPDGRLLLQKHLAYPELRPVIAAIGQLPPPGNYAEMNLDGLQLPLVTRDVSWDARAKRLLLLLGNERTVILGADGRDIGGFAPNEDVGNLQNISVRDNGQVLATIFGSPYLYRIGSDAGASTTERR